VRLTILNVGGPYDPSTKKRHMPLYIYKKKMLDLQHQYNNCTTTPHMRVGPTHWGPPSCERLLCNCCDGVVQESNPKKKKKKKGRGEVAGLWPLREKNK
jgi:hypothetical protein